MSYHSALYKNKQFKRLIPDPENWQLMWIKGKPAKTKNTTKRKDNFLWVFGNDFIAKLVRK